MGTDSAGVAGKCPGVRGNIIFLLDAVFNPVSSNILNGRRFIISISRTKNYQNLIIRREVTIDNVRILFETQCSTIQCKVDFFCSDSWVDKSTATVLYIGLLSVQRPRWEIAYKLDCVSKPKLCWWTLFIKTVWHYSLIINNRRRDKRIIFIRRSHYYHTPKRRLSLTTRDREGW